MPHDYCVMMIYFNLNSVNIIIVCSQYVGIFNYVIMIYFNLNTVKIIIILPLGNLTQYLHDMDSMFWCVFIFQKITKFAHCISQIVSYHLFSVSPVV